MNKLLKRSLSFILIIGVCIFASACKKRESVYIGNWYIATAQAADVYIDIESIGFDMYVFIMDDGTAQISLPGQEVRKIKWEENEQGLYLILDKDNAINCKIVNGLLGMVEPGSGLTVYFERK